MKIYPYFEQAFILKRYKRFMVDIRLANGEEMTIHCPNTGSMKNCWVKGGLCWFSRTDKLHRKLLGTLELTVTPEGFLCGVNTQLSNYLVREGIECGIIKELQDYEDIRAEVKYGSEKSRIDFLLSKAGQDCYVEVKNVTFGIGGGRILFPDAVTERGVKHLRELIKMVGQGHRSMLVFCVQHAGAKTVGLADEIDPYYAQVMQQALSAGVEVIAYSCRLSPEEIAVEKRLPFIL